MANFAVIEDGVVVNIIIAESKAIAEEHTGLTCIEYEDSKPATIGWTYDGKKLTNPNPGSIAYPE
jgi:hypothetical protein